MNAKLPPLRTLKALRDLGASRIVIGEGPQRVEVEFGRALVVGPESVNEHLDPEVDPEATEGEGESDPRFYLEKFYADGKARTQQ